MLKARISILIFLFPFLLFAQTDTTITRLFGFEDASGNTHLFYHTHYSTMTEARDTTELDFWHVDVSNSIDTLLLSGTKIYERLTMPPFDYSGDIVSKIYFFDNNPADYIYIRKSGISLRKNSIVKSGTGEVFSCNDNIRMLYISRQNPNTVYAVLDSLIIKSTDGGITWPALDDTNNVPISFTPLRFSPFDENVIFGYNSTNELVKSDNGGRSFYVIQPDREWNEKTEITFDADGQTVYAVSDSYGSALYKSTDGGKPYTWNLLDTFSGKIKFKADAETAGKFYFIYGRNLFYSSDKGNTIDTLFTFENVPVDFHKQQGADVFFVALPNRIVKAASGNTEVVKRFSICNTLSFFPLSVGNKWVYHYAGMSYDITPQPFEGYTVVSIVGDSVFNGHLYFRLSDGVYYPGNSEWIRIDSTTAQIRVLNSNRDIRFLDLLSNGSFEINFYYGILRSSSISDTTLWGQRRLLKNFDLQTLSVLEEKYAQGIGLVFKYDEFDFGYSNTTLQGCVIDGTLLGDTTTVGVKEDKTELPTGFKLFQNYPNPFSAGGGTNAPATTIKYSIPNLTNVGTARELSLQIRLTVYDILGRKVATLVDERQAPGNYSVQFNAKNLPAGIYFYTLRAGEFTQTKKMILLK